MTVKLLLLSLFILTGCGPEVKINSSKLEQLTTVTNAESFALSKEGILLRFTQSVSYDQINLGGKLYKVSKYSSYIALEFIAAKPSSTQLPIRFKGELKGNEMVLEMIEAI